MKAGDPNTAAREFRAAIAAGSLDAAAAHSDLAESYIATGDKVRAKKEAIAAMEVAPGYPARAGSPAEAHSMRMRALAIALLAAAAIIGQARPAAADERFVLIVSGVSGSEKIAANQDKWVTTLVATLRGRLGVKPDHIVSLTETGTGAAAATREAVTAALASLKQRVTANDTLMVVLIGHGTSVGTVAKFNLVGPDMDSTEWKLGLDGIQGRVIFVDTTSSSFPFVQDLSAKNRIVISATDSRGAAIRHDVPAVLHRGAGQARRRRTATRTGGCRCGKRSRMPARR